MHRAAYHFIKALSISSLTKTKHKLRTTEGPGSDEDGDGEDVDGDKSEMGDDDDINDIDISLDIEAAADDVEAMASTASVTFEPGDVLGKLLAFVNQVRMSSEGVRDYLKHACVIHQLKPMELRLWVRTRWGSMSNCLESTLAIQKVRRLLFGWYIFNIFNRQSTISVLPLMEMKIYRRFKERIGPTITFYHLNGSS
jgi:hypothetical protein